MSKPMKKIVMKKSIDNKSKKTIKKEKLKKRTSKSIPSSKEKNTKEIIKKKKDIKAPSKSRSSKRKSIIISKEKKSVQIISDIKREARQKRYHSNGLAKFARAVQQARELLKIKGFIPCGGSTPQGQELLAKARELYRNPLKK